VALDVNPDPLDGQGAGAIGDIEESAELRRDLNHLLYARRPFVPRRWLLCGSPLALAAAISVLVPPNTALQRDAAAAAAMGASLLFKTLRQRQKK